MSLSRAESTEELELVVPVFMVDEKIDVNAYAIDHLDVDLLKLLQ